MKRFTAIAGILILVGAMAVPVMTWAHGWGWGHHMMGTWGGGPDYGRDDYGNMTSEQKGKLDALERKFYEETGELQDRIGTKSGELDAALGSASPDLDRVKALQKEISELRAKLDEKRLDYEIEARKIAPDQRMGSVYGGGYGRHMGSYGRMMGSGSGGCWN